MWAQLFQSWGFRSRFGGRRRCRPARQAGSSPRVCRPRWDMPNLGLVSGLGKPPVVDRQRSTRPRGRLIFTTVRRASQEPPPARGVLRPQVLLKAFVANLKSSSPTVRRTAAGCAVSVCQHSRRTQYFYSWLLNALAGMTQCSCCRSRVCSRWTLKLLNQAAPSAPGPGSGRWPNWGMGTEFGLSTGRGLLPWA